MQEVSEKLLKVVAAAEAKLRQISPDESLKSILPGGWSRKQVLGHLIDSASNNHQRFVRASLQESLDFPSYDQEGCVRVQAPHEAEWPLLISLWGNYNRYLAHVIARLPANKLETPCQIGKEASMTLRDVVGGISPTCFITSAKWALQGKRRSAPSSSYANLVVFSVCLLCIL